MNWTSERVRAAGGSLVILARIFFVVGLLASVAVIAPHAAEAGGPRINASYTLSGGTIRVQGSRFRDHARVRITLVDRSQGPGYEVTREMTTRANKRGAFTVTSPGWCPRIVEITATDINRGATARDVLENSDCPW